MITQIKEASATLPCPVFGCERSVTASVYKYWRMGTHHRVTLRNAARRRIMNHMVEHHPGMGLRQRSLMADVAVEGL